MGDSIVGQSHSHNQHNLQNQVNQNTFHTQQLTKANALITSKEYYKLINPHRSDKKSNNVQAEQEKKRQLKNELVMMKRQAKTINQLMGEDRNMKNGLELNKINWYYKKSFHKSKNEKYIEFQGVMNKLMTNIKSSEKNLKEIKKKNDSLRIEDPKSFTISEINQGGKSKRAFLNLSSRDIKSSSSANIKSENTATFSHLPLADQDDLYAQDQVDEQELQDRYSNRLSKQTLGDSDQKQKKQKLLKHAITLDVIKNIDNQRQIMIESADRQVDFARFNNIITQTQNLCETLIPDIKSLAKTKRMQDKQFKTDKIRLIEVLKSSNYINQKRNRKLVINEQEELHPYLKFLGYDNIEQIPNLSKRPRMEIIESRYLYSQFSQVEKKNFQQIKEEQQAKNGTSTTFEKQKRQSSISIPKQNAAQKRSFYSNNGSMVKNKVIRSEQNASQADFSHQQQQTSSRSFMFRTTDDHSQPNLRSTTEALFQRRNSNQVLDDQNNHSFIRDKKMSHIFYQNQTMSPKSMKNNSNNKNNHSSSPQRNSFNTSTLKDNSDSSPRKNIVNTPSKVQYNQRNIMNKTDAQRNQFKDEKNEKGMIQESEKQNKANYPDQQIRIQGLKDQFQNISIGKRQSMPAQLNQKNVKINFEATFPSPFEKSIENQNTKESEKSYYNQNRSVTIKLSSPFKEESTLQQRRYSQQNNLFDISPKSKKEKDINDLQKFNLFQTNYTSEREHQEALLNFSNYLSNLSNKQQKTEEEEQQINNPSNNNNNSKELNILSCSSPKRQSSQQRRELSLIGKEQSQAGKQYSQKIKQSIENQRQQSQSPKNRRSNEIKQVMTGHSTVGHNLQGSHLSQLNSLQKFNRFNPLENNFSTPQYSNQQSDGFLQRKQNKNSSSMIVSSLLNNRTLRTLKNQSNNVSTKSLRPNKDDEIIHKQEIQSNKYQLQQQKQEQQHQQQNKQYQNAGSKLQSQLATSHQQNRQQNKYHQKDISTFNSTSSQKMHDNHAMNSANGSNNMSSHNLKKDGVQISHNNRQIPGKEDEIQTNKLNQHSHLVNHNNNNNNNNYINNNVNSNQKGEKHHTAPSEVADIFNSMTLQDLTIMRRQAESQKGKTNELFNNLQGGVGQDSEVNRFQKGYKQIQREMLTYQEQKNDIVDSWEKKQLQLKQKNRQQIKDIIRNHYEQQQRVCEEEEDEEEEEEEEEKEIGNYGNNENSKAEEKNIQEQNYYFNFKDSKQNKSKKVQAKLPQLTYEQLKTKNMLLIKQAKNIAAHKSHETYQTHPRINSSFISPLGLKLEEQILLLSQQSNQDQKAQHYNSANHRNSQDHSFTLANHQKQQQQQQKQQYQINRPQNIQDILKDLKNKNNKSVGDNQTVDLHKNQNSNFSVNNITNINILNSYSTDQVISITDRNNIAGFLSNLDKEEEGNNSPKAKNSFITNDYLQKQMHDYISGDQDMHNAMSKIQQSESQESGIQQEGSFIRHDDKDASMNAPQQLFNKEKRNTSLKLLKEKQQQKLQIKKYLQQVLARFNRSHSNNSDSIMKQIQKFRRIREKNQAEVDFDQMNQELIRRQHEFKHMMEGKTEEMIKKKQREGILYQTQMRIYSNKKFDQSKFFRDELQWKATIEEVNEFTEGLEGQLQTVKNTLTQAQQEIPQNSKQNSIITTTKSSNFHKIKQKM